MRLFSLFFYIARFLFFYGKAYSALYGSFKFIYRFIFLSFGKSCTWKEKKCKANWYVFSFINKSAKPELLSRLGITLFVFIFFLLSSYAWGETKEHKKKDKKERKDVIQSDLHYVYPEPK